MQNKRFYWMVEVNPTLLHKIRNLQNIIKIINHRSVLNNLIILITAQQCSIVIIIYYRKLFSSLRIYTPFCGYLPHIKHKNNLDETDCDSAHHIVI